MDRTPNRRRDDGEHRDSDRDRGRKELPKRRSAMGKIVGKTVEWIEKLDALEERTFGDRRRAKSSQAGQRRPIDSRITVAVAAFDGDTLRSQPQRPPVIQPEPQKNSTNVHEGQHENDAAVNTDPGPIQNPSSIPQSSVEHRNPRHRPHTSGSSDSHRNHTHRDPSRVQAPQTVLSYRENIHERQHGHQHRRPSLAPSAFSGSNRSLRSLIRRYTLEALQEDEQEQRENNRQRNSQRSRSSSVSSGYDSDRSSSALPRRHISEVDQKNEHERRDTNEQRCQSLSEPSRYDSDPSSSRPSSTSDGLPSRTSTEMNAVDLSAMSRRASNAGRGKGQPVGSRSVRADQVRETAQHRAYVSRPPSPVPSSGHLDTSSNIGSRPLRESNLSALPQQGGTPGSLTASWVDDQRPIAPTATRSATMNCQPAYRQNERAVAVPSGYNQNLRGRHISSSAIRRPTAHALDELLARQMRREWENADRRQAAAAQNDEAMAREMEHEWNLDAVNGLHARDEEWARQLQAEEDSANRTTDKLRKEELALNEHVARQIAAELNKAPDAKNDERLARELDAEERNGLAAANLLHSETLEDNERAARRFQAEADNEVAAANAARDDDIAANERAVRLLQAEDENDAAAAERSRKDALEANERAARRLEAEDKQARLEDLALSERVARQLQAEENSAGVSLDTQRAEELALNERVAQQLQAEENNAHASNDTQRPEELALNERAAQQLQAVESNAGAFMNAQREQELAFNERVAREMQEQYDNESADVKHINDIEEDERAARRIEAELNGGSGFYSPIVGDYDQPVNNEINEARPPIRLYSEPDTEDLYGLTPPRSPVIPPANPPQPFPPPSEPPMNDRALDVPGGEGLPFELVDLRGDVHPSGPVEWIIHHQDRPNITFRYRMMWRIRIDLDIMHKAHDDVTFEATVQVSLEIIDDMPDYEEAEAEIGR